MPKTSAGLLMYRVRESRIEVLLVHPGGPFWQNKEDGAWTIPKGGIEEGEDAIAAARREFFEETGLEPREPFVELSPIRQKGGKVVRAWAFAGDCSPGQFRSISFTLEWPPRSGQVREFPEIDRAEFFEIETAKRKINPAQTAFLQELKTKVTVEG